MHRLGALVVRPRLLGRQYEILVEVGVAQWSEVEVGVTQWSEVEVGVVQWSEVQVGVANGQK